MTRLLSSGLEHERISSGTDRTVICFFFNIFLLNPSLRGTRSFPSAGQLYTRAENARGFTTPIIALAGGGVKKNNCSTFKNYSRSLWIVFVIRIRTAVHQLVTSWYKPTHTRPAFRIVYVLSVSYCVHLVDPFGAETGSACTWDGRAIRVPRGLVFFLEIFKTQLL